MACPTDWEQREVWGPALEKVQFHSPWNQFQQQWTSTDFEPGLKTTGKKFETHLSGVGLIS